MKNSVKLLLLSLLLFVNAGNLSHTASQSKDSSYKAYSSIDVITPDSDEEDPGTLS